VLHTYTGINRFYFVNNLKRYFCPFGIEQAIVSSEPYQSLRSFKERFLDFRSSTAL